MNADEQTLEELEGKNWGEPESAPTPMVAKCLRLRRVPLKDLGPADLRLLIGQKIGLKYLVSKALHLVVENSLVQTEYFPGDLLSVLLRIDKAYWDQNMPELQCLASVAGSVFTHYRKIVGECEKFLEANASRGETLN